MQSFLSQQQQQNSGCLLAIPPITDFKKFWVFSKLVVFSSTTSLEWKEGMTCFNLRLFWDSCNSQKIVLHEHCLSLDYTQCFQLHCGLCQMKYLSRQKPENGHFKSFHFWAISNLHRMTGRKNDTYHENKTRSSPETLIHFTIYSAAGFLFFSTTFHRHMPPNFTFLSPLLWLVVVPSVIYICKSF